MGPPSTHRVVLSPKFLVGTVSFTFESAFVTNVRGTPVSVVEVAVAVGSGVLVGVKVEVTVGSNVLVGVGDGPGVGLLVGTDDVLVGDEPDEFVITNSGG